MKIKENESGSLETCQTDASHIQQTVLNLGTLYARMKKKRKYLNRNRMYHKILAGVV